MSNASIIIPCWNSKKDLQKNLPAVIKAYKNKNNKIIEIIVVDDFSPDDSVIFLQKNYPRIKIIRHSRNKGFSATVNTGVRNAEGKYVVLLNADVAPFPSFLTNLLPLFRKKDVFGISLSEEGYSWAKASFINGYFHHSPGPKTTTTHETMWISGGSGVFKKSIWSKLAGMDENLFTPFYWEDVDISYRALKRGYKLLWEPRAKVIHKHESVINPNNFNKTKLNLIKERNELLFLWKNITNPILFRKHISGVISRIYHTPGYIKVFFFALTKIVTVAKARQVEKREEKISDIALLTKFQDA